ncbi:hypothetical protein [Serratia marcescens]|uniref:hypothetical protein n=1 Tax=Serratia marcescens TaxID=615 RepID=UPI0039E52F96
MEEITSPTRSDFIMHISCMIKKPCKPLWSGISAVLRSWGLMQNHAPYTCMRSLRQASQKKAVFGLRETVKPRSKISIAAGPAQSMKCLISAITAVTVICTFSGGGKSSPVREQAKAPHRSSKKTGPRELWNAVGEAVGAVESL